MTMTPKIQGSRVVRLCLSGSLLSNVTQGFFPSVPVLAKRDDELWPLSGNKARKAFSILQMERVRAVGGPAGARVHISHLENAPPPPPPSSLQGASSPLSSSSLEAPSLLCSYGGGQSNAMESLARACFLLGKEFHYFTRRLPKDLKDRPRGNLHSALVSGMILHECDSADAARSAAQSFGEAHLAKQGGSI